MIFAKANPQILESAGRFFDGSGATIAFELLQNARRAGATEIVVDTNLSTGREDSGFKRVVIRDNGRGVSDFAALLDFGNKQTWGADTELNEDSAGMGFFSLYATEGSVVVRSGDKMAVFTKPIFEGKEGLDVIDGQPHVEGTSIDFILPVEEVSSYLAHLDFVDSYSAHRSLCGAVWAFAMLSSVRVILNGEEKKQAPEVTAEPSYVDEELGLKILITKRENLNHDSRTAIAFLGHPVGTPGGMPRGYDAFVQITHARHIKPKLPDRQKLTNEGQKLVDAAVERALAGAIPRLGPHTLEKSYYDRFKTINPDFPEAEEGWEPVFHSYRGLISAKDIDYDCALRLTDSYSSINQTREGFILEELAACPDIDIVRPDPAGYSWQEKVEVIRTKDCGVDLFIDHKLVEDHEELESPVVDEIIVWARRKDGERFDTEVDVVPMCHPSKEEYQPSSWCNDWYMTRGWAESARTTELAAKLVEWFASESSDEIESDDWERSAEEIYAQFMGDQCEVAVERLTRFLNSEEFASGMDIDELSVLVTKNAGKRDLQVEVIRGGIENPKVQIVVTWDSQDPDLTPSVFVPRALLPAMAVVLDKSETYGGREPGDEHDIELLKGGAHKGYPDHVEL